ncbi:hypothetical protein FHG87_002257 [Trinorchestia longiramus]|nr:hypothetical protein FHG87_002257 [Trinorchestia longiramus]
MSYRSAGLQCNMSYSSSNNNKNNNNSNKNSSNNNNNKNNSSIKSYFAPTTPTKHDGWFGGSTRGSPAGSCPLHSHNLC